MKSFSKVVGLHGQPFAICAAALAMACGGHEPSEVGALEPAAPSGALGALGSDDVGVVAPPPAPISATLGFEGNDLTLAIDNPTDAAGTLQLNARIDNPRALFMTNDAGSVEIGAHAHRMLHLSASDVQGLDLAHDAWTDAHVGVSYVLADGREGSYFATGFAEYGRAAAPHPVVSSGKVYGIAMPADASADTEAPLEALAASTFQVCAFHVFGFPAKDNNPIDYFKGPAYPPVPAYGTFLRANPGNLIRYLDSNGCTTFPLTPGNWTFELSLTTFGWPVIGAGISAKASASSFPPTKQVGPFAVTASTTSLQVGFAFNVGIDADLQSALVIAQQTIKRAMSLGTVIKQNASLTIINDTSNFFDIPSSTVHLTNGAMHTRQPPAHETGHWIYHNWVTTTATGANDTYCTPNSGPTCTVPPNDGCRRAANLHNGHGHGQDTISWQSTAHLEGIADFFAMLAYNDAFAGADCWFPGALSTAPARLANCESEGIYMATGTSTGGNCFEWNNSIFTSVGNEYDWTKMYWDLFADETGLGASRLRDYLSLESTVTSWNTTSHFDTILNKTGRSSALGQALLRQAPDNIYCCANPH